jgi:dihydrofolate synthase/folylpolyglutamate synthase
MMSNKDHEKFISYFKKISSLTVTEMSTQHNAIKGKDLLEKFKNIPNVYYQENIEQAIRSIPLKEGDLIIVTGSLYFASEVLKLN